MMRTKIFPNPNTELQKTFVTMMNESMISRLIELAKNQLNAQSPYWVLFEHGTSIVFKNELPQDVEELKTWALEAMKRSIYLQRTVNTYQDDIIPIAAPLGWLVPTYFQGIYTFVAAEEFKQEAPSEMAVWVKARNKQNKDAEALNIVYINYPEPYTCH